MLAKQQYVSLASIVTTFFFGTLVVVLLGWMISASIQSTVSFKEAQPLWRNAEIRVDTSRQYIESMLQTMIGWHAVWEQRPSTLERQALLSEVNFALNQKRSQLAARYNNVVGANPDPAQWFSILGQDEQYQKQAQRVWDLEQKKWWLDQEQQNFDETFRSWGDRWIAETLLYEEYVRQATLLANGGTLETLEELGVELT